MTLFFVLMSGRFLHDMTFLAKTPKINKKTHVKFVKFFIYYYKL